MRNGGLTDPGSGTDSGVVDDRRTGGAGARVPVRVLGPPEIADVPPTLHVRPQAVEFLTYLVVSGGSAHQDDIFDDLMPEPPRRLAAQRLHTYTYNLRQIFTAVGGGAGYLRLQRHRYTLARDFFAVDLWSMREAVAEAAATTEPGERIAALQRAVGSYGGPLAEGTGYLWVAAYREAARRDYVAAVVALAGMLGNRPEAAAALLAAANRHHPDDPDLLGGVARLNQPST